MKDAFGRNIDYMRISVTDRCDLRCLYCMPEGGIEKLPMDRLLTYEEIVRISRAAAALGITRLKITGGEPLVRKGCPDLIRSLKEIPGIEQVTLTTNGQQLVRHLDALLAAGLDAVNISLDSLRADRYRLITRGGELDAVLEAVSAAKEAGLRTKINCLPMSGLNEDEIEDFAAFAFDNGLDVRFIEIMPVGFGRPDEGVSNTAVLERLQKAFPDLEEDDAVHGNGPAVYYRRPGRNGAVGLISAMHGIFCSSCNRIRLTSTGRIKPCLCYEDSVDLLPALALDKAVSETCTKALEESLRTAVLAKPAAHCFTEQPQAAEPKSMSEIGG